jgi:hypothetical protein
MNKMDPFNIVIRVGTEQLALNIHPEGPANFKLALAGELIGEIFKSADGGSWQALPREQMQGGDASELNTVTGSDAQDLLLDNQVVQRIGLEISKLQNGIQT